MGISNPTYYLTSSRIFELGHCRVMKLQVALPCSGNINNKNSIGQKSCFVLIESEGTKKIFICYHEIFGHQTFQIVQYISEYDANCYGGIVRHWTDHFSPSHSDLFSSLFCSFLSLRQLQSLVCLTLWLQEFTKTGTRLECGWKKISRASWLFSLYFICCLWLWLCLPSVSTREPLHLWSLFLSGKHHSYSLIQWSWVLDLVTCSPRYEPLRCGNDFLFFLTSCLHHYILPSQFTCSTNFLCCISAVWNI